ncbi:hypothetical protein ONA91_35510 [Micromonospora sp. DR5-3]|uniref:hypothetical protein n=1 Tax=unclassified Micromonospora TaxID=2617518 RepID=UPI0011D4DC88|nr:MULTISPECIES: hypothetical protein [unclassified Micromonospora]MCW3819757.1 hypothetical protein [Micromonospora sp. DR5-3]TYC19273.1 hypothetical protein FXF52_37410 [Micromonospora sp. MP36]
MTTAGFKFMAALPTMARNSVVRVPRASKVRATRSVAVGNGGRSSTVVSKMAACVHLAAPASAPPSAPVHPVTCRAEPGDQ